MASVAGTLIYSGIMPLIKTFITILFGYILARKDLFPLSASRGASQVTMNVALPALIFANIVPAFTPSNVSAIGPLLLIGFVYVIIGFLMGFLIREFCYVPRNFYQGLIVMSGTSNWGNLPTAVVLTVTQESPFNPSTDPALGVSFVAIFIVVYYLVFWVLGAAHSISWDYLPNVPQGEAAEHRVSWKEKPIGGWFARLFLGHMPIMQEEQVARNSRDDTKEKGDSPKESDNQPSDHSPVHRDHLNLDPDIQLARSISRVSITSLHSRQHPPLTTLPIFETQDSAATHRSRKSVDMHPTSMSKSVDSSESSGCVPPHPQNATRTHPFLVRIYSLVSVLISPVTLTLAISIPIALIQPLKALFVDTTSLGGPNFKGPDGRPPLFFIIDTASFVGGIAVPMALILLGASFARLSVPRPISRLPLPAMFAMALAKMLVLPVIGIFMVQTMVKNGLIPRENKAERFVAMFLSGTPAAVNQLIVTQLYSPDGDVDTLSVSTI
ncbi:auxin efflux carrier [Ramaria rubella]|nr:auxin efflux carrier [Ramaria rubella]